MVQDQKWAKFDRIQNWNRPEIETDSKSETAPKAETGKVGTGPKIETDPKSNLAQNIEIYH